MSNSFKFNRFYWFFFSVCFLRVGVSRSSSEYEIQNGCLRYFRLILIKFIITVFNMLTCSPVCIVFDSEILNKNFEKHSFDWLMAAFFEVIRLWSSDSSPKSTHLNPSTAGDRITWLRKYYDLIIDWAINYLPKSNRFSITAREW